MDLPSGDRPLLIDQGSTASSSPVARPDSSKPLRQACLPAHPALCSGYDLAISHRDFMDHLRHHALGLAGTVSTTDRGSCAYGRWRVGRKVAMLRQAWRLSEPRQGKRKIVLHAVYLDFAATPASSTSAIRKESASNPRRPQRSGGEPAISAYRETENPWRIWYRGITRISPGDGPRAGVTPLVLTDGPARHGGSVTGGAAAFGWAIGNGITNGSDTPVSGRRAARSAVSVASARPPPAESPPSTSGRSGQRRVA